jgi:hypothetical protein
MLGDLRILDFSADKPVMDLGMAALVVALDCQIDHNSYCYKYMMCLIGYNVVYCSLK